MKIKILQEYNMFVVLLVFFIGFSIISPIFRDLENFRNLLNQQSTLGIATIAMAVVILSGGIDLSVGSVMALAGVYYSNLVRGHLFTYMPDFMKVYEEAGTINPIFPEPLSLCFAVGTISLLGILTGFVVAKLQAPPFVVTVGTMILARGIAYSMTSGQPIFSVPDYIVKAGFTNVLGVPILAAIWFLLVIALWLFFRFFSLGRDHYVVGGNLEAARFVGINITRTIVFSYWLSSFLSAFAGVLLVGRMASADPRVGSVTALDAIAASVIGGFSLSGGKGNLINTVAGVLLIGLLTNILSILRIEFYTQQAIKGLTIILIVAVRSMSERKSKF